VSPHILGGTPDSHPHYFCDESRHLIDFPMATIITHEPLVESEDVAR
jgi:hypothetical protein